MRSARCRSQASRFRPAVSWGELSHPHLTWLGSEPHNTIFYTNTQQPRAGPVQADPPSPRILVHLADLGMNLVTNTKTWKLLSSVYGRQLPLWEPG